MDLVKESNKLIEFFCRKNAKNQKNEKSIYYN